MLNRIFAVGFSLGVMALGCAPTSDLGDLEAVDGQEDALSLSFQVLDVAKADAAPGLTIIRRKADYVAFFGAQPPAGLNFNKSWVLHYALGQEPTGGYEASFLSVDRVGPSADRHLEIVTSAVSPGPNCMVTEALTMPQMTVKIPKQKSNITVDHLPESTVTDCGTVQNFCWTVRCAAGFVCDEFTDACVEEEAFCPRVRCAAGFVCDEDQDACVEEEAFCPRVRCANGYVCDEEQDACVEQ